MPPDPHPAQRILEELAELDFDGANEETIRAEWINPLLSLLGYGARTLNTIRYSEALRLPRPVRALGSRSLQLDYRPTVLGVGLWIVEAKRPQSGEWDERHLGQAWSYATHPDVDVPLMVLADGTRITVWDITEVDWAERPAANIEQRELPRRFTELEAVLGARRVADFVLTRQLRHLQRALEAQVEPEAVDAVVSQVRAMADAARPKTIENRRLILRDVRKRQEREWRSITDQHGAVAIAIAVNQPFALNLSNAHRLIDVVRGVSPADRAAQLDAFVDACRTPQSEGRGRDLRMFWMARVTLLAACLRLLADEGVEDRAAALATEALSDHLRDFPQDPTARAAHRFELVLTPALLRGYLAFHAGDFIQEAERLLGTFDRERALRTGVDPSTLFMRRVDVAARRKWFAFTPWTADALNSESSEIEELLPQLKFDRRLMWGPAADPFLEDWAARDPLKRCTGLVVAGAERDERLSESLRDQIRALVEPFRDELVM